MLDPRQPRLPAQPPAVSPPPPLTERRASYRRAEDRQAHQEKVLLARALDVLAADTSAEARLAGLLRLLARTAGARRAAVLADGIERRCAVSVVPGEDPAAAEALAGWLDARATRSRAERAASGRAPISLIVGAEERRADPARQPAGSGPRATSRSPRIGPSCRSSRPPAPHAELRRQRPVVRDAADPERRAGRARVRVRRTRPRRSTGGATPAPARPPRGRRPGAGDRAARRPSASWPRSVPPRPNGHGSCRPSPTSCAPR